MLIVQKLSHSQLIQTYSSNKFPSYSLELSKYILLITPVVCNSSTTTNNSIPAIDMVWLQSSLVAIVTLSPAVMRGFFLLNFSSISSVWSSINQSTSEEV
jgi:hypothetical protein